MKKKASSKDKSEKSEQAPFCAAPFAQLSLLPDGMALPCCHLGRRSLLGKLTADNFQEIWNGEALRALRREFLSGEIFTCAIALRYQRCNKNFERFEPLIERAEFQKGPPIRLDLRLNSECNLRCIMCLSWSWGAKGYYDKIGFWEGVAQEIIPSLREIDFLGGEPFIQKETFQAIDIISGINPDCQWTFTTNAHWRFSGAIESALDKIKIQRIAVSIDSLNPKVYAQIREGGRLDVPLKTLEALIGYREKRKDHPFRLQLNVVIQKKNYTEIPAFVRFVRQRGMDPYFNFLHDAGEPIGDLSIKARLKALDQALGYAIEFPGIGIDRLIAILVDSLGVEAAQPVLEKFSKSHAELGAGL